MLKQLGQRSLWLLLTSLLLFSLALGGRLAGGQASFLSASETKRPARASATNAAAIADLRDRLRLNPEDTTAYAHLGLALLRQVRETGDASLYGQAEQVLQEAIKRDPRQFDALIGQGLLALARHEFAAALAWGEKAKAVNPYNVKVYGIIGDAQLELGRYEAAAATIQKMMETRPELSAYSRVSYLLELHGDMEGAVAAMQQAVDSGLLGAEGTLWAQVQLGHLYFKQGDLENAEKIYRQALDLNPDYRYALAGLARVRAAQGAYEEAIEIYEPLVETTPLPEFVIALGELYEANGRQAKAQRQYELVQAIEQLQVEAGMNVDLEFALFKADHGLVPQQTVKQAHAAYERRPTIYGADVLAWAFYQTGDYVAAQRYSQEALRLGTREARLYFHAGMIAHALGDATTARRHLQQALAINPYFSIRDAAQARAALAEIQG